MEFPSNVKYTKEHEWIRVEGDIAYVGITDYAQEQLGDIVFVDITTEGETLEKDEVFGTIEVVKTISDLFLPVSGEVLEQVDGEHRHQNGETVDYAQYYQFVLDGHDTKISEEKKQEKCHKRNHKRREYA